MKRNLVFCWLVIMVSAMVMAGCSKSSSLDGKVTDSAGKPLAGITVIAKQLQPVKGYEQFEAMSGSDGSFKFKGLYPQAPYLLMATSQNWTTNATMPVVAAAEGETRLLPGPFVIASAVSRENGIDVRPATGEPVATTLHGKVVDGAGSPIAGVKIIAKQMRPVKGYEQYETETNNTGEFTLSGLFPSSNYSLLAASDSWSPRIEIRVASGQDGQGLAIQEPLVFRFFNSPERVIVDSKTSLEWLVGPDEDTNYSQAEAWVQSCKISGGGWRMPTLAELKGLYTRNLGDRNMDPFFKTTGWWVWAEPKDSSSAWNFDFKAGQDIWTNHNEADNTRAFGVRSAKN